MSYFDNQPQIITKDNDYFNLLPKTQIIKQIISSDKFLNSNIKMVALFGGWGTGKTSVMRTLQNEFATDKTYKIKTELFEAWKYERDDDLSLSLFSYLARNNEKDPFIELFDYCRSFIWGTAKGVKLNLTLPTNTAGVEIDMGKGLEEAQKTLEKNISDRTKSLYGKENEYEKKFKQLINKLKGRNNKKLIVFIDDLDRCEPDRILNLMASIKNFFTYSDNIIFICGIDRKAVETAIETKYGNLVKSEEYLEKIFDFTFDLPVRNSINGLIEASKLLSNDNMIIEFENFLHQINFTNPRKVKKLINKLVQLKLIQEINKGGKDENQSLQNIKIDFKISGEYYESTMFIHLLILKLFYPSKYEETKNIEERISHYCNNFINGKGEKVNFATAMANFKHKISPTILLQQFETFRENYNRINGQHSDSNKQSLYLSLIIFFAPREIKELNENLDLNNFPSRFHKIGNEIQVDFCEYLIKNRTQIMANPFSYNIALMDFFNVIDEFI